MSQMKKIKKLIIHFDERLLEDLRAFAKQHTCSISSIIELAVTEYLAKRRIKAAFKNAMDEVVDSNKKLLKRLSKV